MRHKPWPEDGKTARFSELVESVRKAIEFAYSMERKNKSRSVPWEGMSIGEDSLTSCLPPGETLRLRQLRYNENEQDRDALDMILGIAIQLGIEQGKRIFKNSSSYEMMEMRMDLIKNMVEGWPK